MKSRVLFFLLEIFSLTILDVHISDADVEAVQTAAGHEKCKAKVLIYVGITP